MVEQVEIKAAAEKDLRRVLRLTLSMPNQSAAVLENQVTGFIRYARALSLDLNRHWCCYERNRLLTACTCVESPGRTATLFLPNSAAVRTDRSILTRLIAHAVRSESRRDIILLQCLTDPSDEESRSSLREVGFRDLATLRYYELNCARSCNAAEPNRSPSLEGRNLEFITYDRNTHDDFANIIAESYRGSLDCPGLCGLRGIEDIIAGHKGAGRFEPRRWFLLRCDRHVAGCILFCESPVRSALELVYMGVHPDSRRNGIGRYLLQHGLHMAYRENVKSVTVAVDRANTPALRLYQRHGFRHTTSRQAMILPVDSNPGKT